jgi:peroxiredoxin
MHMSRFSSFSGAARLGCALVLFTSVLHTALAPSFAATPDEAASEIAATTQPAAGALGQKVSEFSLRDYRGKMHQLSEYADKKLVVVAFLGNECPLAKLYAGRLNELAGRFDSRGVAFLGVNSNCQDSLTEIAAFARIHEIAFPILKDTGNELADLLGAERTPEVYVLDAQRAIRYRGQIDDQHIVGRSRPQARRELLREALDSLLAGGEVAEPRTAAVGCHIGRAPKTAAAGEVTFSGHIAAVLNNRCVRCHRAGEIGPFPLTSYEEVVGWAETIREVVDDGRMPPWFANPEHGHYKNDARLPAEEKKLLAAWIDGGCPEGDPAQLPEPPTFVEGWQISEPDLVVYIADKPHQVPAEGTVAYQYFMIDPGFKEDKWIKMAEARPGNRAVVHHIIASFMGPNDSPRRLNLARGGPIGYAPGISPARYPEGAALFVKAGSKIVFQVHYTPNGTPQEDRSYLGLVFAEPNEVKYRVGGGMSANPRFEIPPGASDHVVRARYRIKEDARLVTMTPHMHLRGKAFRYEAVYPDGTQEILLDVPKFDFNWQLRYDLAEPKLLPKGTVLACTAKFDNSEDNLANPNPKEAVRWGDQTWEEMMIGYFTTLPTREDAHDPTVVESTAPDEEMEIR